MSKSEHQPIHNANTIQVGTRRLAAEISTPFLRGEVHHTEDQGLDRFRQLVAEGHGGVLVVRHISMRDVVQVGKDIMMESPTLANKRGVGSLAKHHHNVVADVMTKMIGGKVDAIVTNNVIRHAKRKGEEPPHILSGLVTYGKDTADYLAAGQLVFLTPEGERATSELQQFYHKPDERTGEMKRYRPLEFLLATSRVYDAPDPVYLFIDVALPEQKIGPIDLNTVNPLDIYPLSKFSLTVGRARTGKELESTGDVDRAGYLEMKYAAEQGVVMREKKAEEKKIKRLRHKRDAARLILSPFLRGEIIEDGSNSLQKFEEAMKNGETGGLVLHRHFSDTDPFMVMQTLTFKSDFLKGVKQFAPVQVDTNKFGIGRVGEFFGIENTFIATKKTGSLDPREKLRRRLEDYNKVLDQMIEAIKDRELVSVAPEAGKQTRLERYSGRTVGRILERAVNAGVKDIPMLIVDVRLAGSDGTYDKEIGGDVIHSRELRTGFMMASDALAQVDGDFKLIDDLVILPKMQEVASIVKLGPSLT